MTMPSFTTAATLVLAMLVCGCAQAQPDDSTAERNRQFIAQAFQKWATGGGTFFDDVLAPDATWTIKGTSRAAGSYKGRDAFLEQAVAPSQPAFPHPYDRR